MVDTPTDPTPSLAILHVISHISWERGWCESFDAHRARLLDTLAGLLTQINAAGQDEGQPLKHVLLGGQTVIFEDISAVSADLLVRLVIANAGGRFGVGPWYVPVDQALVSGEALVRNFLLGAADAQLHGARVMPVAYTPGAGGHTANLPQILRGFGIDAVFLHHGAPIANMPFRWRAPDGSSVLVIHHHGGENGVQEALESQKAFVLDGPFLWLNAVDEPDKDIANIIAALEKDVDVAASQSTLKDYVKALRQSMPDALRPALVGELRLQPVREHTYLLPGTLSSRIHLKQNNTHLQTLLSFAAEPYLALALTHGDVPYPDNLRALLEYSWRTLIKTQSRNVLGGCSSDAVHEVNEIQARQAEETGNQVIDRALRSLPGQPYSPAAPSTNEAETYIVVWNPHNFALNQVVEASLCLPPGKHPAHLLSPTGEERNFGWSPSGVQTAGIISLLAEVPPVGYATYTLELGDEPPGRNHLTHTAKGRVIGNVAGETLVVENTTSDARLVWKREETQITDLLRFIDGGDAGDVYNYSPPVPDKLVIARPIIFTQIETSPMYSRLILLHRMRIASSLNASRGRERGLRLLELRTTATFYDQTPGVYFHTTFTNPAGDHRLRAHIRTGIHSEKVTADAAFGLVQRDAVVGGPAIPPNNAPNMEGVISTHPMHSLCAVGDDKRALALLARGLPEFEAVQEGGQTTLALTLLRAVGWLSRGDLRTRSAAVGPQLATPGAQCLRPMSAEYALLALDASIDQNAARLMRAGMAYSAPPQAYQYQEKPKPAAMSYLTVEGDGAVMTALKPPQKGDGWIVRFVNPSDAEVEVQVAPHGRPQSALLVNLAEEPQAEFEVVKGKIKVKLNPHQIVSVRFGFA